jgi:hypothetical protein
MERYDYAQGEIAGRLHDEQPTMDPSTGGSASTGERDDPTGDQSPRATRRSTLTSRDNDASPLTIIFKDHLDQPYIWPFELCQSRAVRTLVHRFVGLILNSGS